MSYSYNSVTDGDIGKAMSNIMPDRKKSMTTTGTLAGRVVDAGLGVAASGVMKAIGHGPRPAGELPSATKINWDASDAHRLAWADLNDKYGKKGPDKWQTKLAEAKEDMRKYHKNLSEATLRVEREKYTEKIDKTELKIAYLEQQLTEAGYEVEASAAMLSNVKLEDSPPVPAAPPKGLIDFGSDGPASAGDQTASHRLAPALPPVGAPQQWPEDAA